MQFSLDFLTNAKLGNVNFRNELHGDDHVSAVDMSFTINSSNTILDKFDPALLPALYKNAAVESGQASLEGVDGILPNFRFPRLSLPLKWTAKLSGYYLTIDYGLGNEDSNIEIDACSISKFDISPREGGTVEVKILVQSSSDRLTESVRGKLSGLIQSEVQILLTAPTVSEHDYDEPPLTNPFPLDGGSEPVEDPFTPELAFAAAHEESPAV